MTAIAIPDDERATFFRRHTDFARNQELTRYKRESAFNTFWLIMIFEGLVGVQRVKRVCGDRVTTLCHPVTLAGMYCVWQQ
jgi:hypothetical protein